MGEGAGFWHTTIHEPVAINDTNTTANRWPATRMVSMRAKQGKASRFGARDSSREFRFRLLCGDIFYRGYLAGSRKKFAYPLCTVTASVEL